MRVIMCGRSAAPLRTHLGQAGFAVTSVDDAEEAVSVLRHDEYDLVVLHCPPGPNGAGNADCCRGIRALRAANLATPALILCAEAHRHVVPALGHGADDVVDLACGAEELAARCKALIRRSRGFARSRLTVGPLTLDLEAREALVNDRPLRLTEREFAIMQCLALRHRKLVTRDNIVANLYASECDEPEGKIIDVFICKIRRKLAAAGAANLITTVWGAGYRMDDQVAA
jgi:two-component system cell cycle response regulator CtrA